MSKEDLRTDTALALLGVNTGWAPIADMVAENMGEPVDDVAKWLSWSLEANDQLTVECFLALIGIDGIDSMIRRRPCMAASR